MEEEIEIKPVKFSSEQETYLDKVFVAKKLAAHDLLIANLKMKNLIFVSVAIILLTYVTALMSKDIGAGITIAGVALLAFFMFTTENKIKYYEDKYDLQRPKTLNLKQFEPK